MTILRTCTDDRKWWSMTSRMETTWDPAASTSTTWNAAPSLTWAGTLLASWRMRSHGELRAPNGVRTYYHLREWGALGPPFQLTILWCHHVSEHWCKEERHHPAKPKGPGKQYTVYSEPLHLGMVDMTQAMGRMRNEEWPMDLEVIGPGISVLEKAWICQTCAQFTDECMSNQGLRLLLELYMCNEQSCSDSVLIKKANHLASTCIEPGNVLVRPRVQPAFLIIIFLFEN